MERDKTFSGETVMAANSTIVIQIGLSWGVGIWRMGGETIHLVNLNVISFNSAICSYCICGSTIPFVIHRESRRSSIHLCMKNSIVRRPFVRWNESIFYSNEIVGLTFRSHSPETEIIADGIDEVVGFDLKKRINFAIDMIPTEGAHTLRKPLVDAWRISSIVVVDMVVYGIVNVDVDSNPF